MKVKVEGHNGDGIFSQLEFDQVKQFFCLRGRITHRIEQRTKYRHSLMDDYWASLQRDVGLTSCTLTADGKWRSGFLQERHYEHYSLRRPATSFGQFSPPDRALKRQRLESAYFSGILFPYYGHFLLESLA